MTRLALITLVLCVGGCVTNVAKFSHTTLRPDGTVASRDVARSQTIATLGSKLGLGKGHASGYVDGKRVSVGQDSAAFEAGGDPAAMAAAIAPMIKAAEATGNPSLGLLMLRGFAAALGGK